MFSDEQPGYYQCNHQRCLTVCCTWHNVAVDTIYNQPIIFKGKTAININKQSSNYTFGHAEVVKKLIFKEDADIKAQKLYQPSLLSLLRTLDYLEQSQSGKCFPTSR